LAAGCTAISAALGLLHLPNPAATLVSCAPSPGADHACCCLHGHQRLCFASHPCELELHAERIFASHFSTQAPLPEARCMDHRYSRCALGPEASILAVVVCLCAGLYLLRVAYKRGHILKPFAGWQTALRERAVTHNQFLGPPERCRPPRTRAWSHFPDTPPPASPGRSSPASAFPG